MPFDSTLDPTTNVILDAIEHLERDGWHKGGMIHGSARCILGALRDAADRSRDRNLAFVAATRVKVANGIEYDLPFWNDAQERTKEQVIEALQNTLVYAPEAVG